MGNTISSALDPTNRGKIQVPADYKTPKFPSLYIPTLSSTIRQEGIFLYEAEAIWHFTFYWTIILLCGIFLLCSLLASLSLLLSRFEWRDDPASDHVKTEIPDPFLTTPSTPSHRPAYDPSTPFDPKTPGLREPLVEKRRRPRRKRPPLWPVFLLPVVMTAVAAVVSVVTGTVVGFALAAVYSAGGFSMSTWVPFLWALIQVVVLIISSYSTLTTIL
ncbi:hypothetical protein BCR39DRAFT_513838 [Naematelia encephala]|uniref:Integral membrane protein n=1 Tax=Naematelia encephala TaxID=71784 RepID=A0A1Y2BIP4_9TREE|nr:hypothetical protein BCR39DRAFT_513838 [Naematelia encephala]